MPATLTLLIQAVAALALAPAAWAQIITEPAPAASCEQVPVFHTELTTLENFQGEVCEHTIVVERPDRFADLLLAELGPRGRLDYRGVDWLGLNVRRNPHIDINAAVPPGAEIVVLLPRLPGAPKDPTADCHMLPASTTAEPPTATALPVLPAEPVTPNSITPYGALAMEAASQNPSAPLPPDPGKGAAPDEANHAFDLFTQVRHEKVEAEKRETPNLASNVGIRYGQPLSKGAVLLPKSRMYNAFAQIKEGIFDGLTAFGDYVPPVTDSLDGQQFKLQWERGTIGWDFSLDLPAGYFLRRLEAAPRIGMWSINAVLPATLTHGGLGTKGFLFQRESLGWEAGAGFEAYAQTSFKLWMARDEALALSKSLPSGAMSQRLGFDFYFPGFDFEVSHKYFKMIFLLYYMHDDMFLTTGNSPTISQLFSTRGPHETGATTDTFYGLNYAGLGTIITF